MPYPIIVEIERATWLIKDPGGECMYALMGEERGLFLAPETEGRAIAERLFGGRPYDAVCPAGAGLATGTRFELGNRTVRAISTPSAAPGDCSFWDEKTRIAFTGKACGPHISLGVAVSDALAGLARLRRECPGLARIYPSALPETDFRSYGPELLEDAFAALRAALAPDSESYRTAPGEIEMRGVKLSFDPNKLRQSWESPSPYPLGI